MERTLKTCWKTYIQCVICASVLLTRAVYGGEFLYLTYPSGSRPNNSMAQDICKANGSYKLAILDSQSEYDRMYTFFNQTLGAGFVLPTAVWMGSYWVNQSGDYIHYWKIRDCKFRMDWALWDSGEPNGPGVEDCTRIHTNMYMRSINCDGTYDILCEQIDKSSTSHCDGPEDCEIFAPCWWTAAKVGLTAGFTSLIFLFCACCIGWKCFCTSKNKVGYDVEDDVEDDGDNDVRKDGSHDVSKNHDIEQTADEPAKSRPGFNSLVLGDTSWMTPQELSFNARYTYKE